MYVHTYVHTYVPLFLYATEVVCIKNYNQIWWLVIKNLKRVKNKNNNKNKTNQNHYQNSRTATATSVAAAAEPEKKVGNFAGCIHYSTVKIYNNMLFTYVYMYVCIDVKCL